MTRFVSVYEDQIKAELARLAAAALPGVELPDTIEYWLHWRHDGQGFRLPYIDVSCVFDSAPWGEELGTYISCTLAEMESEPPAMGPRAPVRFVLEAVEVEEEADYAHIWTPETGEWRDEPGLRDNPPLPGE